MRGIKGLFVAVLMFGMLYTFNDAEVANPGELLHPLAFIAIAIAGVWFVIQMWTGKGGLLLLIVAVVVGMIIMQATIDGTVPSGGPNPCPGDEIVIAIGGKCMGMDADANVEWIERQIGVQP